MRDLTEEELKLAPSWDTHYIVDSDESIIYESEKLCWWVGRIEPLNNEGSFGNIYNKAIKHFDITKHEFSDPALCNNSISDGRFCFFDLDKISINKQDAIAIAKALGVTGEDLR